MKLTLIGHDDRYAVEQLQLTLFADGVDGEAVSTLHRGQKWLTAATVITVNGKKTTASRRLSADRETVPLRRRALQQSYYLAALPHLEEVPAWGALAGVRPTKITTRHLLEGGTTRGADRLLEKEYFVTPQRRSLAVDCSVSTVKALEKTEKRDISLYVGIPFCPTRCAYCSFVSRSIGRQTELIRPYLEALLEEISLTGKLLANSGRTLRTIYVGGGTPTSLSTCQMEMLLSAIRDSFDLSRCIEFTVEGGRPDTLSPEKLAAIRAGGADRMSINPQSMIDSVLRASGRPHTAGDVINAWNWACSAGFDDINMDLIAGLPTDTVEGFCRSLDQVASLAPANITVHTLALKKDADLFRRREQLPDYGKARQMVDYANTTLRQLGYRPYYLYRQKYMSGSFENVGWSRDGRDCLYNIYMMEELHTILSVGGGGMNKVNLPDGTLRRFHNPKFPEQYIQMLPDVLREKQELFELMKGSV